MSECSTIIQRLGSKNMVEPCETWAVQTQIKFLESSEEDIHRTRMKSWLTHVFTNGPTLVKRQPETYDVLDKLISVNPMNIEQSVYIKFLARELGALDYTDVRITNEVNIHDPHPTFRNEWWNLTGRTIDKNDTISLQVWRHTLIPSSQWDSKVDPKLYSAIRFSWSVNDTVKHSPWMLEGWELGYVSTDPFQIHCGKLNWLKSTQNSSLFPMDLTWENVVLHNLDYIKPSVMLHSNVCLSCSDGVGIKMYMYPEIKNEHFVGYFSHAWESGVMPEGYSANIALRGLTNIERTLLYPSDAKHSDRWLSVKIHLENGYDIWAFFTSTEVSKPHRVAVINETGASTRLKQHEVELVRQDGLTSALLRHSMFSLQWTLDHPITSNRHSLTSLSHGHISGMWLATPTPTFVKGYVVLETPDLRTYDERAKEILDEVFPKSQNNKNYFDTIYFSSGSDVLTSVAIWLLPLLFGIFLLMTIIYLVLVRPKEYPWIRHEKKTWWKLF